MVEIYLETDAQRIGSLRPMGRNWAAHGAGCWKSVGAEDALPRAGAGACWRVRAGRILGRLPLDWDRAHDLLDSDKRLENCLWLLCSLVQWVESVLHPLTDFL